MKVVAVVQARLGSTRLPNKVMATIGDVTLIGFLLRRLSKSQLIDEIILATSTNPVNDPLSQHVSDLGYSVVRGSEDDVLDRYLLAANSTSADVVIRITGDCPLVDPDLVDQMLTQFFEANVDYLSNTNPPTFPDGFDVEVFTTTALKRSGGLAANAFDREHVTPQLRKNPIFSQFNVTNPLDYSHLRLTVDEQADLLVVRQIVDFFAPQVDFSLQLVRDVISSPV